MNKDQISFILGSYLTAKKYHADMISDIKTILMKNLSEFGDGADDYELSRAAESYKSLLLYNEPITSQNRIYIVSGLQCISFCALNVPEILFKKLDEFLRDEEMHSDDFPNTRGFDCNLIISIFLFENSDLIYSRHIYPYEFGIVMNAFGKHNLAVVSDVENWKTLSDFLNKINP